MSIKILKHDGLETLCEKIKAIRHTAEDANNLAGLAGAAVLEVKDAIDNIAGIKIVGSGSFIPYVLESDIKDYYMPYDTSKLDGNYILTPIFHLPLSFYTLKNGDTKQLYQSLTSYVADDKTNSRFVLHLYNGTGNVYELDEVVESMDYVVLAIEY